MKEPISGDTIFKEFIEKNEWNKEEVAVQNPYMLAQIVSFAFTNIENAGYIKMIVGKVPQTEAQQDLEQFQISRCKRV